MTIFSSSSFADIFIRQSQNTARLGFEIQFQAIKRRLDTELNTKKEEYNNIDKTLEPMLAGYKRDRAALEKQKDEYTAYLKNMSTNVRKSNDLINNLLPKLSAASTDVGPDAEANFNFVRDQMNKALRTFVPASLMDQGVYDQTRALKNSKNASGVGDYSSYATLPDRAQAVGILLTGGEDGLEVIPGLSYGFSEDLGVLRNKLTRDFDHVTRLLGKTEPKTDKEGNVLLDEKGKPLMVGLSGVYKKMYDIDRQIEKIDAEQRLAVLQEAQTMEKKHDRILESLSLSFEFAQANAEMMADRTSFLKPQKGSIMNLFI